MIGLTLISGLIEKTLGFGKNLWTFEQKPDSKVAVFHGFPKPHQSEEQWAKDNWR